MVPTPQRGEASRFHDLTYPYLLRCYDQAKADVARLGLTAVMEHAIAQCMVLVQAGQSEAAADLLFDVCGQLREKSGTWTDMRKTYEAPVRH